MASEINRPRAVYSRKYDPYALELFDTELESIDLSSLEEIRGDGLRYALNSDLCYVGDLRSYLTGPGNQKECVVSERRPPSECSAAGLTCHPQCNSTFNCWGPMDHQCDSCANYQYINRCVMDCSEVVATLPADSAGLYQNEAISVCEQCDQECLGGCAGGTGPEYCNNCRNLFIQINASALTVLCVSSCPVGTYLRNGTTECVPCHEGCDPATGCVGPIPYLDLNNGCLDCDYVILNRNGTQRPSATHCETCLTTNYDPSTNCTQCLPGWDLTSDFQCIGNRDLGTNCSSCLPGYDSDRDCAVCEDGRDIATRCASCLSGFTGPNCRPDAVLSTGLVGGIVGGLGGALLLVILIMTVLIILLVVNKRSSSKNINTDTTDTLEDKGVTEVIEMSQNPVYSMGQARTNDSEAIQLQPNVLYGVNTEDNHTHQDTNHTPQYETVDNLVTPTTDTDHYENEGLGPTRTEEQPSDYDYIQV